MELHVLHKHGWSISALAREFGLNWRTVKREVESPGPRQYPLRDEPTALSEVQLRHVERRLAVCPSLRGTDLHAELQRDYGYTGSYPAFARKLRRLRPAQVRDPEIRFETDPGLQTQADWALVGAWLMWRGIYLSKLPGVEKRLRVLFDWTLDLVFPRDIVVTSPEPSQAKVRSR